MPLSYESNPHADPLHLAPGYFSKPVGDNEWVVCNGSTGKPITEGEMLAAGVNLSSTGDTDNVHILSLEEASYASKQMAWEHNRKELAERQISGKQEDVRREIERAVDDVIRNGGKI